MFGRLLAVGVAWLAAVILFAALLQWSGSPPPPNLDARAGVTGLARSLNAARPVPPEGVHTWTVTKATSALGELVVEVAAVNPTDAPRIAEHLVAAVRTNYDEILVYVQAFDPVRDPLVRRVEWTPRRGYLESAF